VGVGGSFACCILIYKFLPKFTGTLRHLPHVDWAVVRVTAVGFATVGPSSHTHNLSPAAPGAVVHEVIGRRGDIGENG
jgi:hypothetical protein